MQLRLSKEAVRLLGLLAPMVIVCVMCATLDTRVSLDTDVVNLALGIERFDLSQHQPHPPGYLGYVLVLRGLHALTGLDAIATTKLAARLMMLMCFVFIYLGARAIAPRRNGATTWALAFAASNPMILYYSVDGQTHAAEAAVAAALVWRIIRDRTHESSDLPSGVIVGLLLAIGGAFRPSFAVISVVPVLVFYWRKWRLLAVAAGVAAAGTAAWAIPTISSIGGWSAYRAASDALVGTFARKMSFLSASNDSRMVLDNVWGLVVAGGLALPVPLVAWWLGNRRGPSRLALALVAAMAGPALIFYSVMFLAEPGYLLGIVPAACLAAGVAVSGASALWRRLVAAALVAGQFAFFLLAPPISGRSMVWVPSASEIFFRQYAMELLVERISDDYPPTTRILVISDRGITAMYRQLPLLRPHTDVLFVYSSAQTVFEATTLGLMTAHSWRSAPGPALLEDGPPSTLRTRADYDVVVVGPTHTHRLQEELSAQTPCRISKMNRELTPAYLPAAECFPDKEITIASHRFQWGQSADDTVVNGDTPSR